METITLALFNRGRWWDAAEVTFTGESMSSGVTISYLSEYIVNCLTYEAKDNSACSVNAPLCAIPVDYPGWPSLFDDILPVGKSRKWWLDYLDVSRKSVFTQHYALLTNACMAPVGNLRIKNTNPQVEDSLRRFNIEEVIQLQYDFLEYANEHGAAVGGATGAGGVAPKLLLMVEEHQVFIDGDFAGKPLSAMPYLTKFARNTRTQTDNNILRAEGTFYKVLEKILAGSGIETIDTATMMLREHQGQVSLWLPRFDIQIHDGIAHRLGVESIYSMMNAAPGSYQDHFKVIDIIWRKIEHSTEMTSTCFVKNYVARDMLNLVFGNSDNHGRNISFIKSEGNIRFAPIYDFAPMKADPEMVTRLFKWQRGCEQSGEVDFNKVANELADKCDPEELLRFLGILARRMRKLPKQLKKLGCPVEIIDFPAIGFHDTKNKLIKMGVLHD